MASNSGTNKRRRTAADTLHISNLPIGFIADVSAYLSKPSRAILAVAFTSSSLWKNNLMHQLSPTSKAIVSAQQWNILDFEDVDKDLANKLTDEDINAILICISAQDVLKRLKLCGCINITGRGLNPLRGSVVLEQIDISFARKNEKQLIEPAPKISEEAVVPILDSIISAVGCSLKYIQFPRKWRYIGTHNAPGEMHPIISLRTRFNQYMHSRTSLGLDCSKCNGNMRDCEWLNRWFENRMICYDCLKPICTQCDTEGRADFCVHCQKRYCTDCIPVTNCTSCNWDYCKGCEDLKACGECGDATCDGCLYTCDGCEGICCTQCSGEVEPRFERCDGDNCNKAHCEDCYNGKEYSVKWCDDCDSMLCNECKLIEAKKDGEDACHTCAGFAFPLLLKENERQKKEITQLREELDEAYRET